MACPRSGGHSTANDSCRDFIRSSPSEIAHAASIYDLTEIICQRILCPIILTFGVPTNLINILVLTRKWMRSSTNIYLTAVAVADTLYLILFFVLSLDTYPTLHTERYLWFQHTRAVSSAACNVLSNIATWLTCTFTIERYIAVSNPMLGRKICTRKRARLATIVVSSTALAFTFPDFLYVVGCRRGTAANGTTTIYATRKTAVYAELSHLGWIYVNQVLFVFAPLLILCVANGLLIRSVLRARRERTALMQSDVGSGANLGVNTDQRHHTQRSGVEQQRITIMLIAVVLVFCVLQLPSTVSVVIIALVKTKKVCFPIATLRRLQTMSLVANLMIMINAAVNFLLYSAFSLKFRRTFQRMLFDCLHRVGYRRQPGRTRSEFVGATMTATPWIHGVRCSDFSRSTLNAQQRRQTCGSEEEDTSEWSGNQSRKSLPRNGYLSLLAASAGGVAGGRLAQANVGGKDRCDDSE